MNSRERDPEVLAALYPLIQPFNTRNLPLDEGTEFVGDLGLDSLAVMELVAAVEDCFDITVPLNVLPEISTIGELASAITAIKTETRG